MAVLYLSHEYMKRWSTIPYWMSIWFWIFKPRSKNKPMEISWQRDGRGEELDPRLLDNLIRSLKLGGRAAVPESTKISFIFCQWTYLFIFIESRMMVVDPGIILLCSDISTVPRWLIKDWKPNESTWSSSWSTWWTTSSSIAVIYVELKDLWKIHFSQRIQEIEINTTIKCLGSPLHLIGRNGCTEFGVRIWIGAQDN